MKIKTTLLTLLVLFFSRQTNTPDLLPSEKYNAIFLLVQLYLSPLSHFPSLLHKVQLPHCLFTSPLTAVKVIILTVTLLISILYKTIN